MSFNVELIENMVSKPDCIELRRKIYKIIQAYPSYNRRIKLIYGGIPSYSFTLYGKKIETKVKDWREFPELYALSKMLERVTGQPYNCCVIQYYKSGKVGIKPHRDKEMKSGTIISSISLGETRIMKFERGHEHHEFPLTEGSLFLIHPPTNDCWLHSIPLDDSTSPRMSLVFRYYA